MGGCGGQAKPLHPKGGGVNFASGGRSLDTPALDQQTTNHIFINYFLGK